METQTITPKEACRVLSVGKTKIFRLINEGHLETVVIGKRRMIRTSSIRALVGEAA